MTFRGIVVAILAATVLAGVQGCAHEERRREGRGPATVAVWEFEDASPAGAAQPGLGDLLSAQVMEVLQKGGKYAVVEREKLVLALEELRLGSSALADEETRLKLGKMAGARYMVFGGYQVFSGRMRLDMRLVEVETGKVRKAVSRMTDATDLSGWIAAARGAASDL